MDPIYEKNDPDKVIDSDFIRQIERKLMKKPFDILVHRNDENVHIKLIGEFDNKALSELIDILNLHSRHVSRIFIHTDALERISLCNEKKIHNRLQKGPDGATPQLLLTGRFSEMLSIL